MPDTCRPLYNAVQERDILTDMANCRARRFPINGDWRAWRAFGGASVLRGEWSHVALWMRSACS